jgi:hypothetical protein
MSNLSPPPLREIDHNAPAWQKWFSSVQALLAPVSGAGLFLWSGVSKVGSNLTDLVTRNHADLQNINTSTYTHLSSTNATDLTDGGDSTLHYHATDRARANHSGTQLAATISDFNTAVAAAGSAPVTTGAATYTVLTTDGYLICSAACTLTLLTAASYSGRILVVKNTSANTVISASSNVVPLAGGAAGTAILSATAGKFAKLVSDGTNWIIMEGN